jgi:hypothetical protein
MAEEEESWLSKALSLLGPSSAEAAITPQALRGGIRKAVATVRSIAESKQLNDWMEETIPKSIRRASDLQVARPTQAGMEDVRVQGMVSRGRSLAEALQVNKDEPFQALFQAQNTWNPQTATRRPGFGKEPMNTIFLPSDHYLKHPEQSLLNAFGHEFGHVGSRAVSPNLSHLKNEEELADIFAIKMTAQGKMGTKFGFTDKVKQAQWLTKNYPAQSERLQKVYQHLQSGWNLDEVNRVVTQRKWDQRKLRRKLELDTTVENEFQKMMDYKNAGGKPFLIRNKRGKEVAPGSPFGITQQPIKYSAKLPVPEIEDLTYEGVQKYGDKPDMHLFTDARSKFSTFESESLDPAEIIKGRDAMRSNFRAQGESIDLTGPAPTPEPRLSQAEINKLFQRGKPPVAQDPMDVRFKTYALAQEARKNVRSFANSTYQPKDLWVKKTADGYRLALTREGGKGKPLTATELAEKQAVAAKPRKPKEIDE